MKSKYLVPEVHVYSVHLINLILAGSGIDQSTANPPVSDGGEELGAKNSNLNLWNEQE